ncbi:MAG TPA: hypothetical protein VGS19_38765 [Streptosporangiaceae bacterium]|nr:hypothetical protein [Streptosporangiaceae bacterium]
MSISHRLFTLAGAAAMLPAAVAAVPAAAATAARAVARPVTMVGAVSGASTVPRTVLLINGDSVSVPAGGQGAIAPAGSGLAGSVVNLGLAGRTYAIPAAALPYVGRGLDLSLFGVRLLAERAAGGRLPVQISDEGHRQRLPGVVITHTAGRAAQGYLTAGSARQFGAALVRQFLTDHARGSYGQDGLFGGGVTVSLAGTTPARAAWITRLSRHEFPMHTLTVTGTNLAGRPDMGDAVFVINADNPTRFSDESRFYRGTAKFSVPAGHYWALGDFIDVSQHGRPVAERVVVLPQFTVSANRSVRMAERAAGSQVAVSTPRPSVDKGISFELRLLPSAGQPAYLQWVENGTFPLYVSPMAKRPTTGRLQDYTSEWRASPPAAAAPYEYDLAYGATGTVPLQHHVANPHGLATIHVRYYSDVTSRGEVGTMGLFSPQANDLLFNPLTAYVVELPRVQTEYLTANPAVTWWRDMAQYTSTFAGMRLPAGGQWANPAVYHAGQAVAENWDTYPLHPGVDTGGGVPSASRAGDILRLDVTPFSDSNGHHGSGFLDYDPFPVTSNYQIDENGKQVASGRWVSTRGIRCCGRFWGLYHFWHVKVGPEPSLIRFTVDSARTRARYPLSTRTQTVWTWRSAPAMGGTLPAGWRCSPVRTGRRCTVEPMMTLDYHVARLALDESAPPGAQVLGVTVGHVQLARGAPVTRTTVEVSFDNGRTWRHAAVTRLGPGRYRAVYTARAGSYVTLRVSAADAAHGGVTETITRAYKTQARVSQRSRSE